MPDEHVTGLPGGMVGLTRAAIDPEIAEPAGIVMCRDRRGSWIPRCKLTIERPRKLGGDGKTVSSESHGRAHELGPGRFAKMFVSESQAPIAAGTPADQGARAGKRGRGFPSGPRYSLAVAVAGAISRKSTVTTFVLVAGVRDDEASSAQVSRLGKVTARAPRPPRRLRYLRESAEFPRLGIRGVPFSGDDDVFRERVGVGASRGHRP